MKNALPIALAALTLSLVALGAALLGGEAPADNTPGPAPSSDPELAARLAELTTEKAALERRVVDLELALAGLPKGASEREAVGGRILDDEALEQLVGEVREALAESDATPPLDDAAFASKVETTIDELRREGARDKVEKGMRARSDRLTDLLPGAAATLGLTSFQETELETTLRTYYEAEAQWQALWTETQDAALVGQQKQADRTNFQDSLANLLTPEQLEAYADLDGWAFPGAGGGGK